MRYFKADPSDDGNPLRMRMVPEPPDCRRCGEQMQRGKALLNRATPGAPDFEGTSEAVTDSEGSEADLVDLLKCPACGHSIGA